MSKRHQRIIELENQVEDLKRQNQMLTVDLGECQRAVSLAAGELSRMRQDAEYDAPELVLIAT